MDWTKTAESVGHSAAVDGIPLEVKRSRRTPGKYTVYRSESTRLNAKNDRRFTRCCKEAGVSKYVLIQYMVMQFIEAWEKKPCTIAGGNNDD